MAEITIPDLTEPLLLKPAVQGKCFLIIIQDSQGTITDYLMIFLSDNNVAFPNAQNPQESIYFVEKDSQGKAAIVGYQGSKHSLIKRFDTFEEAGAYAVNSGLIASFPSTIVTTS